MSEHIEVKLNSFYYGFPVFLATTTDLATNTYNITPLSSSFCLSDKIIIGVVVGSKLFSNINNGSDISINIPDYTLWQQIENIAQTTNLNEIPKFKKDMGYTYCENKFALGKFSYSKSLTNNTVRINECQIQAETKVEHITVRDFFAIVELKISKIFVDKNLLDENGNLITKLWKPLLYKFKEYDTTSEPLGFNFRYGQ